MTDNTQPEALRLANVCSNLTRYSMEAHLIAAELRLQHARIAELEAQLEAIAASAGSEPVAWKHDCAALLANDVDLWIDACPHCGKPRMHATQAAHPSSPEGTVGVWQDIATAPKDGSEVLASTAGLGRIVVYWDDDESQWGTGLGYLHRDAPTHWMPLPPHPPLPLVAERGSDGPVQI